MVKRNKLCKDCRWYETRKLIISFIKSINDTMFICPICHCEHEIKLEYFKFDFEEEFDSNCFDGKCENCEKEFMNEKELMK